MFKTIKGKLLLLLLSFVFVTIATSMIAFNYFVVKKDSLGDISQKVENTHVLLLQDIKIMHEFFENETINPVFFYTGESDLITAHRKICSEISASFDNLNLIQEKNDFSLNDSIANLEMNFSVYTSLVDDIIIQVLKRGYKDFGIEGKMRKYAHLLESQEKLVGLENILQLRRHEKDFIIRQEDHYLKKHNNLLADLQNKTEKNTALEKGKKDEILVLLASYGAEFRNLVVLEKKLGLRNSGGLKKKIELSSDRIETSLSSMVKISKGKVDTAIMKMEVLFLVIGLIFLIISVISAVEISKRASRSISGLKNKIKQFVESDFTQRTVLPISNSVNEIDVLITNVSIMEQHIVNQVAMLKQSNKDLEMLFYATSRDIRSPLITMKRLVDVATTKITDKPALAYLGMMKESWTELYNIVDELGIVTSIRSVETKIESIDLESLIRNVYAEFKPLEWFDNIIFSLDLRLKNEFQSSPGLVRAIFRNMFENSIKYATKRSGHSFLKISVVDQNDEMVRIEISDNGIGIKKEFHEKIFDMFFRGTTSTSGTGLGLYIVKCSLEKLNGAIGVESSEEKGTTFTILLPNNSELKNTREKIIQKIEMFNLNDIIA